MKLTILGSSSSGNCYVLKSDSGQYLVIECGVKFAKIKKAIDFDVRHCAGILITHEHGDHAGHVRDALKTSIPVYMSAGTKEAIGNVGTFEAKAIEPNMITMIGEFRVLPFGVKHDAVQPFGFVIDHRECGRVMFATDTYFLPVRFAGLSNILIECNYKRDRLDQLFRAGKTPGKVRDRIIESHMEFDECVKILKETDLSGVVKIGLIHLSDANSDAEFFRSEVARITGKDVFVASPNMEIEFNKTPF